MLFSIVIPVYNVAPYLRECLDSLLAQTYGDWEALCVDDGSTDGSGAILDVYAKKDSRFRVVHQANRGVSAARNRGMELIQGDFFGFVDADDWVEAWWLKDAADRLTGADTDILTYGMERFDDCGHRQTLMPEDKCFTGFTQSLYRTRCLRNVRFPPYSLGEDRAFAFRCLAHTAAVELVQQVVYHYRTRSGSAMHSYFSLKGRWNAFLSAMCIVWTIPRLKCVNWVWKRRLVGNAVYRFSDIFKTEHGGVGN